MNNFWKEIENYAIISLAARKEWEHYLTESWIKKGDFLLMAGDIPKKISFINNGLFSYFYTDINGNNIIKKFFTDNMFVASTSALIKQTPSNFSIQAIEDTFLVEYRVEDFKSLVSKYFDIAKFYIKYLEKNWVVEKEPDEIMLKSQTATERYKYFIETYPELKYRLKQHHIASFLGITPTQLSRIRRDF